MRGVRILLILTVVLALGPIVPGSEAQQAQPSLGLDPTSGPPGANVDAIGQGWPKKASVSLWFDATAVRTTTTSDTGNLATSFEVPPDAKVDTDHVVTGCAGSVPPPCSNVAHQTAKFRVTAPPTTTTSSTTTTTTEPSATTTTGPETTTTTTPAAPTSSSSSSSTTSTSTTTTTTAPPPGPGAPPAPARPAPILLAGTPRVGIGTGLFAPSTTVRLDEAGVARLDAVGFRPRCTPPAGAEIVDFDDLPAGSDPSEAVRGLHLSADNIVPVSRARTPESERLAVFEPSTGTISEANGVRWRDAGDGPGDRRYGENVVEIRFDTPQRVVGLYVGQVGTGDHGSATLRTGQADAPEAGLDTVLVSGGSALVTCMLVFRPDGSAFDTVTLTGVDYNRPEFDRLFFSEAPFTPPRPGGVSKAEIFISEPDTGESFDAATAFTVTGGVFLNAPRGGFPADAAPLDEVRITWVDWDGVSFVTREVELEPPSRRGLSDGRASALNYSFRLDGVKVPPGASRIHAVAVGDGFLVTDDVTVSGTGAPDRPVEGYARRVDFQPLGIEVTQGLRPALRTVEPGGALSDDTVHVARRTTVVRLYGRTDFSGAGSDVRRRALPAEARLWGFSRRGALPGSPLPPRIPVVDVAPVRRSGLSLAARRLEADASWNFVLPHAWTEAGDVTLLAEINPRSSPIHLREADGTGGAGNFATVRRVRFAEIAPRPVNLILAESHQRQGGRERRFLPGLDSIVGVLDYWHRTWPIPDDGLQIESTDIYRQSFRPCTPDDPSGTVCQAGPPVESAPVWDNGVLAARYPDVMDDDRRRYIPLLFSPDSLVGCSGAAGVGGPPLFHAGACGRTVAQEAGHSLGLIHVSDAHGESRGGAFADRFGGDHGQLEGGVVGWDLRTMQPVTFEDGDGHRHDFMSYGGGSLPWVSMATWNHLARALRASDRDAGLFAGGAQPRLVATSRAADDAPGVLVAGRLFSKGRGVVDSLVPAAEGAATVPEPGKGSRQARLELRDANGKVLLEKAVQAAADSHLGAVSPFRAVVPSLPRAVTLALVVGDKDADSMASEPAEPVISQVSAVPEGDALRLEFHAGAADRDPLEVWFQARVRGGWRTVAGPLAGTTAVLPTGELGAATGADVVRFVATDGLHPVASDVLLANLPPPLLQAAVEGVPVGGRVAAHRALTFQAVVTGAGMPGGPGVSPGMPGGPGVSPGMPEPPALEWTLDGEPAGTAPEATLAGVAPGPHTLKLVATAADGRTAQSQASLDVQADADGDGLTDGFEREGGLDPQDPSDSGSDTDGDRLAAWEEQAAGSDPRRLDTDGDDYSDEVEVAGGSDPADKASVPVRLHGDPTASVPRVGAGVEAGGGNGLAALAGITTLVAVVGGLVVLRRRMSGPSATP
jgi:hypothetical protein